MPTPSPYFESAGQVVDQSKAALLKAVAEGGTAGKQSFDAAQAQAAQAKQEAVARAAQRSATFGVGGNDQTFLGAYDDRMNQQSVNRTNFESGLAQTQASGESYMEKVRAAIPVHQSININKGLDQETKIKTAIAAAQAKAQAELDKENRSLQRTLDAEARSESRAVAREGRTEARASVKSAAKEAAKMPKFDDLAGQAKALTDMGAVGTDTVAAQIRNNLPLTNDMLMTAQDRYAFNKNKGIQTSPDIELMKIVAEAWGMSPAQANAILTPQKINTYVKAQAPAPALLDSTAKSLATKYDTKGVTYELAKSVLNNVDFKDDVQTILAGAGGKTRDEVEAALRQYYLVDRKWPSEYHILVGEYLPLLPE